MHVIISFEQRIIEPQPEPVSQPLFCCLCKWFRWLTLV